jgi:hypothetical protein
MILRARLAATTLALVPLTATGCIGQTGGEATSSTAEPVESQYAGSGTYGIDQSSPSNNLLLAATGVVYVPLFHDNGQPWVGDDGSPMRATCGVTFISSHYAVTAAHCVDGTDLPSTSTMFPVEQIDVSATAWPTVQASENETDSFLTGFPGYTFSQLSAAQGYKVTRYNQCHVVTRCSYDNVNCSDTADVALIACNDRPWWSPSIPVASSDDQQGGVSMEWYHEVYSGMPLTQPPPPTTTLGRLLYIHNEDRYAHYTVYPPVASGELDQYVWTQNFHYYGGGKNQLLPLMAMDYREGDLFWNPRRLGKDPNLNNDPAYDVVWTDLYGCHGTSGSGVFQWVTTDGTHYTPQLLGPVSSDTKQSGLWTNLCDTYSGMAGQGMAQLGYPVLRHTQGIIGPALTDYPIIRWSQTQPPAPAPDVVHLYDGPPVQARTLR